MCMLEVTPTFAINFTDTVFFGDSNTDNGRFRYLPAYTAGINAGNLDVTGVYTTPGGLMWSEYLGQRYGVSVRPTTHPNGGNNYAAGGTRTHLAGSNDDAGANAWSTREQITAYLASTGGRTSASTLYTVYTSINDLKLTSTGGLGNIVNPQSIAGLNTLAGQTADLVSTLHAAGAKYIFVPNVTSVPLTEASANASQFPGWSSTWASSVLYYNQTMWNAIAARGINIIPADFNNLGEYVLLNPARFGITNTSILTPACGAVSAPNCTAADLVTPNAMNTHYFADLTGHVASGVQKIQADYVYGLLVAPSQVSALANQASLSQLSMNNAYLDQIGFNHRAQNVDTFGAWMLGGVQQVNVSGSPSNTNSTPYDGSVGVDYQYDEHLLLGSMFSYSQARVHYNGGGNFTQSDSTVGAYAGYKYGALWANGLVSYTWLDNNLNRVTPIGITHFGNGSSINGVNMSLAGQTGYTMEHGAFRHGPVLGYTYVKTNIDGFTESGNFNSLSFAGQHINAQVGSAGYQAQAQFGDWLPFTKVLYNHHLNNTDRVVTTTLTTVTAPSYTMPAVRYGQDWVSLTASLGYQIDPKTVIRTTWTQQVAQSNVDVFSAMVAVSRLY